MEETDMQIDVVDGKLPHNDNVLGPEDEAKDFVIPDGSPEDSISNTIYGTPFLSSVSLPNRIPGIVKTVSIEVGVPAVTDIALSGRMAGVNGSVEPVINSTLFSLKPPSVTIFESSNLTILESSNLTVLESASSWSSEEIGAVIIVSFMVPFILLSNIIVILSVIRFRRLHTPTNYFVTSLAAVDIFVALATPFMIVVEVFHFGEAARPRDVMLCLLPNRVLMMGCGVSVLTLAAIAYDRHTALVSPLEYSNIMTPRRVAVMVSLSWIYSVVIVWLPLMVGWYNVPSDVAPCSSNLIQGKAPLLFLSAIFVPSCIAILVCYFRIFMVARHHVKAIAAIEFAVHRRLQVKVMIKDTKYATTLALVIGAFLALWLPYLICIFMKTVSSMKFDIWLQTYLILLAVFNSGINPWLYAFKNNELRSAFKRLFKELCTDKFCKSAGRRSSLVSAVTSTPRLSLTDSRVISIIPNITLNTNTEKLKKSLDFLDEFENKHVPHRSRQCSQTQVGEISLQPFIVCLKQSQRLAVSCSNLCDVRDTKVNKKDSLTWSKSTSLDFAALTGEFSEYNALNRRVFSDDGLYHQVRTCDAFNKSAYYVTVNETNSTTGKRTNTASLQMTFNAAKASPPQAASTSPPTTIHLQPPPTISSPRCSVRAHPQEASSCSLTCQSMLTESAEPPLSHTLISPALQPHSLAAHLQQDKHQHAPSPCFISDTLRPEMCSQEDKIPHDNFSNQASCNNVSFSGDCTNYSDPKASQSCDLRILSHTMSCPIFKPATAYHFLLPICETLALDVIATAACLENCVDFARLVNCDNRILMQ